MTPTNQRDEDKRALPEPTSQPNAQKQAVPLSHPAPVASSQSVGDDQSLPPHLSQMPAIAEDTDVIEQEWVDKAKAIVEHNREDPYKMNEEMNKIKADYIKKRYN